MGKAGRISVEPTIEEVYLVTYVCFPLSICLKMATIFQHIVKWNYFLPDTNANLNVAIVCISQNAMADDWCTSMW